MLLSGKHVTHSKCVTHGKHATHGKRVTHGKYVTDGKHVTQYNWVILSVETHKRGSGKTNSKGTCQSILQLTSTQHTLFRAMFPKSLQGEHHLHTHFQIVNLRQEEAISFLERVNLRHKSRSAFLRVVALVYDSVHPPANRKMADSQHH